MAAALAVLTVCAAYLAIWWLPILFATGLAGDERATAINAARIPVGVITAAIFAASAAAAGVVISGYSTSLARETLVTSNRQHQERLAQDALAATRTAELTQASQYNDRYVGAVQLLGDSDISVRLGGIHALEQLARENPTTYYSVVVDVLVAYIRSHGAFTSQRRPRAGHDHRRAARLSTDIQSAMTILGRRHAWGSGSAASEENEATLDFRHLYLRGVNLRGAKLRRANFYGCDLEGADMRKGDFRLADFREANMKKADLSGADLIQGQLDRVLAADANFTDVTLSSASAALMKATNATFYKADLSGTNLQGAQLQHARFSDTTLKWVNMQGASLVGANLGTYGVQGADLLNADVAGLVLGWTNLAEVKNLTQEQVQLMSGWSETHLPPGIKTPSHWISEQKLWDDWAAGR